MKLWLATESRSQIEVRLVILILRWLPLLLLCRFRPERLFLFSRRCFFSFLPPAFPCGLFPCLLALVFGRTGAGDGELAFFFALDVAEDFTRCAAAKCLVFRRFFASRIDVACKISIMERVTMLGPALLHPAVEQHSERDECHKAEPDVEHAMTAERTCGMLHAPFFERLRLLRRLRVIRAITARPRITAEQRRTAIARLLPTLLGSLRVLTRLPILIRSI